MEVKERTLTESGSCPQIGRQQPQHSPRLEISPNRSTTFLSQENQNMKRLSRTNRSNHNPIQRGQQQQPQPSDFIVRGKPLLAPPNLCRPCGDVLDYSPMCCVPKLGDKNKAASRSSSTLEIDKRYIDVIVRIRPKNRSEEMSKTMVWKTAENALIFDPREKNSDFFYKGKRQVLRNDFGKRRPNKNLAFGFDYVFGQESTNEDIFETSLKGLISKVLTGFNCTVFAYGATGSGKTYTMLGSADQSSPGLSVLMAEELYRRLNAMQNEHFTHDIKVSYLEVYNETIKDLFNPEKELSIREDGKQGLRIPQLTVHRPEGPQELLRLLRSGNENRSQHATDFNAESSRSHAVFEITVQMHQHSVTERFKQRTATSRLFMVDLAGSEKGSVNLVDGMRQREGANINKSLLALSNCINALADGKQHIPYRNSKLTRLLKDSLSGNCVTVMIANISPAENTYEDTHNTLHYASRAKIIKVSCKQNAFSEELIEEAESNSRITDLQNEVRMLAQELADERRKHQVTRELLECQVGDGDGFGGDRSRRVLADSNPIQATELSPHQKKKSQQVLNSKNLEIYDIASVNRLMDLFKRKTELVTNLTDSCIQSRLVEWEMKWKKVQVDIAEMIGRPKTTDTEHFISITRLRNIQSDLEMTTHPGLTVEGEELETSLKNINYEIENVQKTCLQSLQQDDDEDLTLSFEEFIRYRSMDMELETMEKLVKFHQQLESCVFGELKNSQIHRFHLVQFIQRLVISLKEQQQQNKEAGLWTKEMEKKFHALLKPVYDSSTLLEPPPPLKRIDLNEDFTKLENVFKSRVVTFPSNEPIATTCSVLRSSKTAIQHKSSELPPATITPSSSSTSIFKINDVCEKDSCLSTDSDPDSTAILKSYQPGNTSRSYDGKFRAGGGGNRRYSHASILPQLKEEDEDNENEEHEMNIIPESPPTSANTLTNETEVEEMFLNQESSTEEEAEKLNQRHQYEKTEECFETSRSRSRRDNHPVHVHQNNITPTNAHVDDDGGRGPAIKQRGKDTRTKSYTNTALALHRGKATTDFVRREVESSKSGGGGQRKSSSSTRSLPVFKGGKGGFSQDGGGKIKPSGIATLSRSAQQKQSQHQQTLSKIQTQIPRMLKKPVTSKPDSIPDPRPFTFFYETTSQSSFDNSFD